MDGYTTKDFHRKLQKLNPRLKVDHDKIAWTHPEYPECGLYYDGKFLYGVPQYFVPVHSIAGVNFTILQRQGDFDTIKYLDRYGFCPAGKENLEEILWRGVKVILSDLCRRRLIDKKKAAKEFRVEFNPNQKDYPRNYVQHITS